MGQEIRQPLPFPVVIDSRALMVVELKRRLAGATMQHQGQPALERCMRGLGPLTRLVGYGDFLNYSCHLITSDTLALRSCSCSFGLSRARFIRSVNACTLGSFSQTST